AGCCGHFALFDTEKAVAGHAGHHLFVWIDFADIPEPRNQQAVIGGSDHFFQRGLTTGKHQIHRSFSVFVGEREAVARRLLFLALGASPAVNQIPGYSIPNQSNTLARNALPIKRSSQLPGVVSVVPHGNVLTEEWFPYTPVKARALICNCGRSKIVEKESHEVEHGCGF